MVCVLYLSKFCFQGSIKQKQNKKQPKKPKP